MNFEELETLVTGWAEDKNLIDYANSHRQFGKFIEEVFEFKREWDKEEIEDRPNTDEIMMEMGDVFVTLIILCDQLEISPTECLEMAWEKISKRRGKTINGTFVKEEDLDE